MEAMPVLSPIQLGSGLMDKPRLLITGGLGFIFSHVTQYFVSKGWDVSVIDGCFSYSNTNMIDGSFGFLNADLSKEDAWRCIFDEQPDYIIHAAAITDVDYSIANPRVVMNNNVNATLNVFKAAKRLTSLSKLLYVNTDEVYGECEQPKMEFDLLFPRNPYAASKAMCSFIRTSFDVTYAPLRDKTAEVRMCNIFGERQDKRKIMPLLLHSIRTGEPIPLQEEGVGYREYLHVKEVAPALELILEKGDRVYNLTNQDGFTVNELIGILQEMTGKTIQTFPATRASHDRWYRMDNTRIKELGWSPQRSFMESLKEYVAESI